LIRTKALFLPTIAELFFKQKEIPENPSKEYGAFAEKRKE